MLIYMRSDTLIFIVNSDPFSRYPPKVGILIACLPVRHGRAGRFQSLDLSTDRPSTPTCVVHYVRDLVSCLRLYFVQALIITKLNS